jgi:hypothetical protein
VELEVLLVINSPDRNGNPFGFFSQKIAVDSWISFKKKNKKNALLITYNQ